VWIVRVLEARCAFVPDSELQQKGDRGLFHQNHRFCPPAKSMCRLSSFNQERGVIETPHVPTLARSDSDPRIQRQAFRHRDRQCRHAADLRAPSLVGPDRQYALCGERFAVITCSIPSQAVLLALSSGNLRAGRTTSRTLRRRLGSKEALTSVCTRRQKAGGAAWRRWLSARLGGGPAGVCDRDGGPTTSSWHLPKQFGNPASSPAPSRC